MQIYHVPQRTKRAEKLLQQLFQFQLYKVTKVANLQMVCHNARIGFYISPIHMKNPHNIDLKLHYGNDFPGIHEELFEILQEENSDDIAMFHGPPGTGKTNYLRYLINKIQDKCLIYVPPDHSRPHHEPQKVDILWSQENHDVKSKFRGFLYQNS